MNISIPFFTKQYSKNRTSDVMMCTYQTIFTCDAREGYFIKLLVGVQHVMKKWIQSDLWNCKNEGSKRFKNNEKWVNKIENQGEIWYKLLKNGKMTDFGETLDHL